MNFTISKKKRNKKEKPETEEKIHGQPYKSNSFPKVIYVIKMIIRIYFST